jgi:hypothetical protein
MKLYNARKIFICKIGDVVKMLFANYFLMAMILLGVTYIYAKPGMIIKKATRDLVSMGVTDEQVVNYLSALKEAKRVPNYKEFWRTCQIGYNLVNESDVSPELKDEVKQTLLRMGVSGIQ